MQEHAIELKNVSYTAGEQQIIKNITGQIRKGKITTLIGPSGAGKTTLFRLLNGLISPTTGDIHIHNVPIQEYEPTELRRMVGLALQSATMLPGTVYENLSLPRKLSKEILSEEEATTLLKRVALEENVLNKDVMDLSGGQRQKVSIARTLVNRPEILLLDEITSSLDRISRQDIERLITSINKDSKITIIWITHNLEQATQIGDDTWVMMNGELIEATSSNLLLESTNDKVIDFVKGDFT